MTKLSVIVPVYNAEKHISECIESIIAQSYESIEIILVNDGSTDSSGELCEYYTKYSNVKVIHMENGGVGAARNRGCAHATGDYITFVDSDDFLLKRETYARCMSYLEDHQEVEVLQFPTYYVDENRNIKELYTTTSLIEYHYENVFREWYRGTDLINYCLWNKIFKSSCFEKSPFLVGRIFEDIFFVAKIADKVNHCVVVPWGGYAYRINLSSLTHTSNTKMMWDSVLAKSELYAKAVRLSIPRVHRFPYAMEILRVFINESGIHKEQISKVEWKKSLSYLLKSPDFRPSCLWRLLIVVKIFFIKFKNWRII